MGFNMTDEKHLTIVMLKEKTEATDTQLDTEIQKNHLQEIAQHFGSWEKFVVEFKLSEAEKADVKVCVNTKGHTDGMFTALSLWIKKNPLSTYRNLLDILVRLEEGELAYKVCKIVKSRVKGNDFGGEHRVECGSTRHGSTIPRSRSARGLDREPDGDSEHRVEYEYASTIPRSRDLDLGIVEARSLDWEHVALGDSEHRVEYAEDFQVRTCTNPGCSWSGEWRSLAGHLAECEHQPVACKYAEYGCIEKRKRKEILEHEENAQLHIGITVIAIDKLTKKMATFESERAYMNARLLKPSNVITHTFKMTAFTQHRDNSDIFYGPPFYTSAKGNKVCARVHAYGKDNTNGRGTHISVEMCLMKGENDDYLTWPFTGTVTFELLNQLKDRGHHKGTFTFPQNHPASQRVVDDEIAEVGFGIDQFIGNTETELGLVEYLLSANSEFLRNDTLIFRVSVQVPSYSPWLECTL